MLLLMCFIFLVVALVTGEAHMYVIAVIYLVTDVLRDEIRRAPR